MGSTPASDATYGPHLSDPSGFHEQACYHPIMTVKFHMKELGNGLRIVGEQDPNAHTSAVGFWISTGSRDEETELMGVSHFLEHMMFKGTERRTAEDVNRNIC